MEQPTLDPRVEALVEAGGDHDEVAVLLRLADPTSTPAGCRVVTRFGAVVTARCARADVPRLAAAPGVLSVKAPVAVTSASGEGLPADRSAHTGSGSGAEPSEVASTHRPDHDGSSAIVAMIDYGLDVAHDDFRHPDGRTRVLALWDQGPGPVPGHPNLYGYGRIHDRADVDAALVSRDPYAAMDYRPWDSDPDGRGSHGTLTTSVAAGNGRGSGNPGVATGADIVFVHLSEVGSRGPALLGDSVALLEAVDFIGVAAGSRPVAVNISLGQMAGAHDGCSLVEQALDWWVAACPGRQIGQSAGNYRERRAHASGRLLTGNTDVVHVVTPPGPVRGHQIDVWLHERDRVAVTLVAPDGRRASVLPDQHAVLSADGSRLATLRYRATDPDHHLAHCLIQLEPHRLDGDWQLRLLGVDVADGRWHAWIEREGSARLQAHFATADVDTSSTTGSLASTRGPIVVGAYDAHAAARPVASFSSAGPTSDGRTKPDLVAPGVDIAGARSRPRDDTSGVSRSGRRDQGTSFAAPFVTGTIACIYDAVGAVPASYVRSAVLGSCEQPPAEVSPLLAGAGYLSPPRAIAAARHIVGAARGGWRSESADEAWGLTWSRSDPVAPVAASVVDPPAEPPVPEPSVAVGAGTGVVAASLADTTSGLLARLGLTGEDLYREFVTAAGTPGTSTTARLVAGPGEPLVEPTAAGDLLVRGGGRVLVTRLVDGVVLPAEVGQLRGWSLEDERPGLFARVTDTPAGQDGTAFARRVASSSGVLPLGQALVRPTPQAAAGATAVQTVLGASEGTADAPVVQPDRNSAAYVRWYQDALNRIAGETLAVDGVRGPRTAAAVRRFQAMHPPLGVDGTVGPRTEAALLATGAGAPPGGGVPAPTPIPIPELPNPIPVLPNPIPVLPIPVQDDPAVAYWRPRLGGLLRPGNHVTDLVDGPETFASFRRAIATAVGPGHVVYLLGWWLDLDIDLDGPGTSMRTLITRAAALGVQVRVMLWNNPLTFHNDQQVTSINAISTAGALLDQNQPDPRIGSQHQKVLVVHGTEGLIAFCGGVDINVDRVCPGATGTVCPPRPPGGGGSGGSGSGSVPGEPLHDVHTRITGPAAADLLQVFVDRWFSHPRFADLDRRKGPLLGPALLLAPQPVRGPVMVRVGETYNATIRPPSAPARAVVRRGVQDMFLTAIAGARRYIYWEDQYLVSMCAAEALRDALPRVAHITVLIPPSEITDMPQVWARRKLFIDRVLSHPDGPAKFRVYCLGFPNPQTSVRHSYVHAKAMFVDDDLAIVGSANCNRRGFEHDAEVAAAMVGRLPDGTPVAKRYRTRLWAEHLHRSVADVDDPLASAALWPAVGGSPPAGSIIRRYEPNAGTDSPFASLIPFDSVIDPLTPSATAPCCSRFGVSCGPHPAVSAVLTAQQTSSVNQFLATTG